jgi:hypothetical protein
METELRITRRAYKGIIEDMFRSNLPRGPPRDMLDAYGNEFAYLARGPPGGPIDDYASITKASSIAQATIDLEAARAYASRSPGGLTMIHNHPIGGPTTYDAEAEDIHKLSAYLQRPLDGLVCGRTGFFVGAAYVIAALARAELSEEERRMEAEHLLDVLAELAGVQKDKNWYHVVEGSAGYRETLEESVTALADVYYRSRKLARAFVLPEEGGFQYVPFSVEA